MLILDDRKAAILGALVDSYVDTGEPVSSAAIARAADLGVSSATIRHELSRLESDGLVRQPHTSAGRIPTPLGYRYYVDHLAGPSRLRAGVLARIQRFFESPQTEGGLFQQTSDLLADLAHLPAVVVGPGLGSDVIHDVALVLLGPETVKLVLVTESGRISQQLASLAAPATRDEVDTAEQLLERCLRGRRLADGIDAAEEIDAGPPDVNRVVQVAATLAWQSQRSVREVFYGGTSQLTAIWADLGELHRLLEFLQAQDALLEVMEGPDDGTTVRLGSELTDGEDADLAVITTTYGGPVRGRGRVGVLGPLRMDYRRTIRLVEEVGEGLGESLGN